MGPVSTDPDAQMPSFEPVAVGEYPMRLVRVSGEEKALNESQKTPGNMYTMMRVEHTTPKDQLTKMNGEPFGENETLSRVRIRFMHGKQGTLRQAFEAVGIVWPKEKLEFESDEAFADWIQQSLDQREVTARLKTRNYEGNWSNDVARFVVPVAA